jgi:hypothetical protein
MAWWITISVISVVNIVVWMVLAAGRSARRRRQLHRGWQTLFSALFVLGCAFRSFSAPVEALRFCLYDGWISIATIGRAVATVAELAFVAQWSCVLKEWCRATGNRWAAGGAGAAAHDRGGRDLLLVQRAHHQLPGQRLRGVAVGAVRALAAGILAYLWLRAGPRIQRYMGIMLLLNSAYVLFMCTIDVPMYWRRWKEDEAPTSPTSRSARLARRQHPPRRHPPLARTGATRSPGCPSTSAAACG